jgi:hypothetical protein
MPAFSIHGEADQTDHGLSISKCLASRYHEVSIHECFPAALPTSAIFVHVRSRLACGAYEQVFGSTSRDEISQS